MRCKCCDNIMTYRNMQLKSTGFEDDICGHCRYLAFWAITEREYVCGAFPQEGVTQPKQSSD
jgi:hypothetical protein